MIYKIATSSVPSCKSPTINLLQVKATITCCISEKGPTSNQIVVNYYTKLEI